MGVLTAGTPSFHAFWMLCGLGTVVFATVAGQTRREIGILAVTLAVAATSVVRGWMPDPASMGALALAAGAACLIRPRWAVVAAACGGALGGVWIGLLEIQGMPAAFAVSSVVAMIALAVGLSRRRPRFAPELLREEALLGVCLLGGATAVLPAVFDGWTAAANLTAVAGNDAVDVARPPFWALTFVGASLALGMVHALWSRR